MPKRLLSVDPLSGLATFHEYIPDTQKNVISYEQDCAVDLDFATDLRNDDSYTRRGMKGDMLHYAHIPDVVLLKMKFEDGVDPFNDNNAKKVYELINSKYSRLKTTNLVHKAKA